MIMFLLECVIILGKVSSVPLRGMIMFRQFCPYKTGLLGENAINITKSIVRKMSVVKGYGNFLCTLPKNRASFLDACWCESAIQAGKRMLLRNRFAPIS